LAVITAPFYLMVACVSKLEGLNKEQVASPWMVGMVQDELKAKL
jgi:hypothetical protein